MNPNESQFKVGPAGSFGMTHNSGWESRPTGAFGNDKMVRQPLPINSSKGGAGDSQYARGKGTTGAGTPIDIPPSGRPKPGQSGPKLSGGMRGGPLNLGGSGGAFGKIK
jgi:hypothetical protein